MVKLHFQEESINLFRYESEFFQNVVNARDIVSWGAVDRSRSDGRSDELIGFVTARIVLAKESEVGLFVLMGFKSQYSVLACINVMYYCINGLGAY